MTAGEKRLEERDLLDQAKRIARAHGATADEILGPRRTKHVVSARRAFVRWLSKELGWSSSAIGDLIGRDHSTILTAIKKLEAPR